MTVGELKKRIEELKISDAAEVHIVYSALPKDLVSYKPYYVTKTINNNLKIIIYNKKVEDDDNERD